MTKPTDPINLPWCHYPITSEEGSHGLQKLPEKLYPIDFGSAATYRSSRYKTESIKTADHSKILGLVRVLAASFTINDPMNRHVQPSRAMPSAIIYHIHQDTFGDASFGPWSNGNIFSGLFAYWH